MKVKKYAVTIQWGEGWHYFRGTYDTLEAAQSKAIVPRHSGKGAKASVMIWRLIDRQLTPEKGK